MPKFLSDLEVQGKINSASATIEDLNVDSIAIGDNVIREGYYGDLAIVKGSNLDSGVFFNNGHDQLYVAGSACIVGGLHVGTSGPSKEGYFVSVLPSEFCNRTGFYKDVTFHQDTTFDGTAGFCGDVSVWGPTYFDTSPLFQNGFCMGGVSFEEHPHEEGAVKFSRIDGSYRGQVTLLTDNSALWVEGNACVQGNMLVRGQIRSDATAVFNTVDACSLIAGGLESSLSLKATPLGVKTALGAEAYGLSVSKEGGLQLWGTHFLQGSVISDNTLKVVHNNISLASTDEAFLGFDYANKVNFWTFPNDGTEATYCFDALQWGDHSHTWYKEAGVRLVKNNQVSSISELDVLNAGEGDQRWVGFRTNLEGACSTIEFITEACYTDEYSEKGVIFGELDVPLRVKGNACVGGYFTVYSPDFLSTTMMHSDSNRSGCNRFYLESPNSHFCFSAKSFSISNSGKDKTYFEIDEKGNANLNGCALFSCGVGFGGPADFACGSDFRGFARFLCGANFEKYPALVSGSTDTPSDNSFITKSYVDNKLSSVYAFKGTKAKKTDLNSITTKAVGDVYNVTEDGMNYAWDGSAWDALGGDLSKYYTKTEVDTKLGGYAKLSSGNTFTEVNVFESNVSNEGTVFFCTLQGGKLRFTNDSHFIDLKQSSSGTSLCVLDGKCLADSHSYVSLSNNQVVVGYAEPQGGSNICTEVNQTFVKTGSLALSSFYSTASGNIGNGRVITIDVADPMFSIGSFVQPLIHLKLGNVNKNVAIPWREPAEYSLVADTDLVDYATNEDVYDRSTIDGVDTGAEVLPKMNELIGYLNDYEEKTGEKLPIELYEETVKAIEEWQKDPTVEKNWNTSSDGTSTNPYYAEAPTKPVVDLNVVAGKGSNPLPSFNSKTNVSLFLPSAVDCKDLILKSSAFNSYLVLPNAQVVQDMLASNTAYNKPLFLPKAVNCKGLLYNNSVFSCTLYLPNAVVCTYLLSNTRSFNHPLHLPHCSNASYGFNSTAMSAENISKTLDSLPKWTDGASHVITFTGSPGASELTQSSPSVAAAIAKGWTVEL